MVLFILFPFLGFYLGIQYQKSLNTYSQQKRTVCTLEAKLCPDGSYVSRQGSDCCFALCLQQKNTPQSPTQYAITPTIIPTSQSGWNTYIDSNNLYSFNFPSAWKVDVQGNSFEPTKSWIRMYYMENNKQYTFELGQGGRGVAGTDTITETQVTYVGQSFNQKIFYHAGSPFLISIVPNDTQTERKYFNHIGIELPPTNTQQYITTFNIILSTFKFLDQSKR